MSDKSEKIEDYFKPGTPEHALLEQVDLSRLPVHVAVIMDGNGRWALKKGLSRVDGHKAGADSVHEIVEAAARLGIKYLTLYAFSRENWKRPVDEIRCLWSLLNDYLRDQDKVLVENELKLKVIGRRDGIPSTVLWELDRVERLTAGNKNMTVILALNYGGRTEIVDAVRGIMAEGRLKPDDLDEKVFSGYLYTGGIPDPDLVIRTSGEMRLSNYLLWQVAYSEFWVTDVLWPEFRRIHLLRAVIDYQKRERRFGDIKAVPGRSAGGRNEK